MKGRAVLWGRVVLAVACVAGVATAGAASASYPPLLRDGDPAVFTGKVVPRLLGTAPGKVVAFAWTGRWKQIPIQIDERKTVSVRDLYPTPAPRYVRAPDLTFDLEVYADSETRTGADPKPSLDADDEIALMAQDAGAEIRSDSVAAPGGTLATRATKLKIEDPATGAAGFVYLFRTERKFDQSAGRSYVDYDFNPLYLSPGQSLRDGYRYANSPNPEDTTLSTEFYSTHSTDRWMDDEIRIKAGDASGVDILDREAAQATKTSCGRSELTFSGSWTEEDRGSDTDEGTFVAVKSGPIRVIRDYMGANSGPYTQRQHIFYERREDMTTFLRVHPMLDLYTWTDYSSAAAGMTYRNQENTDGVPVDGAPDVLEQPDTSDFGPGKVFWEQLVGPQGSVSTVASVETTIPSPSFGSYYLDDTNLPLNGNRRQCAGDGVSYGASGFGILGPVTPNTDPRLHVDPLTEVNSLTVERVRYFGSPQDGAASAAALADRVRLPLAVSSSGFAPKTAARLRVRIRQLTVVSGKRRSLMVPVRVSNTGTAVARSIRVCLRTANGVRGGCRFVSSLGRGRSVSLPIPLKVRSRSGLPRAIRLVVTATSKGVKTSRDTGYLRLLPD